MGITVGIDLGTTNSALARLDEHGNAVIIANAEGIRVTPSCVAFGAGGVVVGQEAKARKEAGDPSVAVFFKREMGNPNYIFPAPDKDYTAVELSSLVLEKLKKDAERVVGDSIERAVITVPAYFRETERRNTALAAEKVGLQVLHTLNEPTAAAWAYSAAQATELAAMNGQRLLVYDLGGGTFDVTLLEVRENELAVLSSEGDYRLGGKDWDERIVDHLLDAFQNEFHVDPTEDMEVIGELLLKAENAKKQLSSATSTTVTLRHGKFSGRYELTREHFADLTADLLQRTRSLCEKLLTQTGLRAKNVDNILLVGGSTRMPMIHELITTLFGKEPLSGVNVDEAVALGAALEAAHLEAHAPKTQPDQTKITPPKTFAYTLPGVRAIHDVTTHSLGVLVESEDGTRFVNEILLRKDTPVPCTASRDLILNVPTHGSTIMDIFLTQGESTSPHDLTFMDRHVVRRISGNPSGKARIGIEYHYDKSGLVHVNATDTLSGKKLPVTRESVALGEAERFYGSPESAKRFNVRHTHTLLVIDLSASMEGNALAEARKAAHRFVEELDLRLCSVGLAVTADRVRLLCAPTRDSELIHSAIDALEIGMHRLGFGNSAHPFDLIYETLEPYSDEHVVALILADGIWYKQEIAIAQAKRCHAAGINIVATGFGTADKRFLNAVASTKEASIFTQVEELGSTFSRIAKVLTSAIHDVNPDADRGLLSLHFTPLHNQ